MRFVFAPEGFSTGQRVKAAADQRILSRRMPSMARRLAVVISQKCAEIDIVAAILLGGRLV